MAVVEAKAAYKTPGTGMQQAKDYAEILGLKFAYATNGEGIVEFDYLTGLERELDSFPTPEELWTRLRGGQGLDEETAERLLRPSHHLSGKSPRYYQEIAINRVVQAVLQGQRRILLTMATGTGKTMVAFQICWKLWSARWNRTGEHRRPRILYLADRNILVDDPKDKTFAPFGDARWKIENGQISKGREMYFAIYQAIAKDERRPGLYREFAPDFFDLIVVDECHRGSAKDESNWREILEYFKPAYQLGMTATPLRADNKATYRYFGNPVYQYSLKQGIEDGCGFVVVEHKMAIVRRVIESIANGATLYNVRREMEKNGILAPAGGKFWNGGTIRDMVREDAYRPVPYADLAPMLTAEALARLDEDKEYGLVYYPRRKVTTLDPDPTRNYRRGQKVSWRPEEERVPIPVVSSGIPRELIDAARARIQNNRASRKKHSRVYQLSGLLRCEVCGCTMIASRKVHGDREYFYYRCTTNQRDGYAKCSNNKGYVAEDTERRILDAVLDAVKDRDELIAKATEDYEAKKRDLLRRGGDSTDLYHQLDKLERQRANYQRAFAADAMSLDDLSARTAELQGEKNHIEGLLAEHEEREERLKSLEEAHQKRVDLIRRGEWRRIGITQPEARRQRYQEIGLSAHADPVGNIRLSWGFGEESIVIVGTKSTRSRSGSRWKAEPSTCSPAGATAPTG